MTGTALAAWGMTGCAGLTRRVGGSASGGRDRLTVQVYGTESEGVVYDRLARRFEQLHRGVTIDLSVVPFAEASTGIDAGLAAGTAPDVFRVDYPTVGVYASAGQLLDLTDAVSELRGDVRPAFLRAVEFDGRAYGVPQHVDTTALLYRPDVLDAAGVGPVPESPADAWSWEELGQVADRLGSSAADGDYPFAVNWQELGAFRWLTWVFMAGGQLYTDDLTAAAIDSDAGRRALDFTASFFSRGWVPPSSSTKAATYPDALFTAGRLGMVFAGNFLLPALAQSVGDRFGYAATFQPRDERAATEIGGNGLVATRDTANPELATDFLLFLAEPRQMADFCSAATLLPSRSSLLERGLDYQVGADLMGVYGRQIEAIAERDVADVTTATFAEVNDALADELEQCFLQGRPVDETLTAIADQVDQVAGLNDRPLASGASA